MLVKLKEIAEVSSGITFRSKIIPSEKGNIFIIQMKDLSDNNIVNINTVTKIEYEKPKNSHFTQKGDIIFRSRGQTNKAALLTIETKNTIVAAPLFRVRVNQNKVLPEYLLWWINQPSAQNYLSSRAKGTMIKMISKNGLENLEIKLPSLKQQFRISQLYNLAMREQYLMNKISQLKSIHTDGLLMQIASMN